MYGASRSLEAALRSTAHPAAAVAHVAAVARMTPGEASAYIVGLIRP